MHNLNERSDIMEFTGKATGKAMRDYANLLAQAEYAIGQVEPTWTVLKARAELIANAAGTTEKYAVETAQRGFADGYGLGFRAAAKAAKKAQDEASRQQMIADAQAGAGDAHSLKAIETMRIMGTQAADWRHVPVKFVDEPREGVVPTICPKCDGIGRLDAHGRTASRYFPRQSDIPCDGGCANCYGYYFNGRGFRKPEMDRYRSIQPVRTVDVHQTWIVSVGYPQWAADVRSASRFHRGGACGLCNKTIPSGEVCPVEAVGTLGTVGMWVGCDCARKFLGMKPMPLEDGQEIAQ